MEGGIAILVVFVLPIVILSMIFSHIQKVKQVEADSKGDYEQVEKLEKELSEVKERLNTLEAIVTDEKYQLNQEFSKLKSANQ